jgi:hypothetical protein
MYCRMDSSPSAAFLRTGGAAADLGDEGCKLPLAIDLDAFTLIELVECLRRQGAKHGQFLTFFAGLSFKQSQTGSHHLAGIPKSAGAYLFIDEGVVMFRQANVAGRHVSYPRVVPSFDDSRLTVFSILRQPAIANALPE